MILGTVFGLIEYCGTKMWPMVFPMALLGIFLNTLIVGGVIGVWAIFSI